MKKTGQKETQKMEQFLTKQIGKLVSFSFFFSPERKSKKTAFKNMLEELCRNSFDNQTDQTR